MVDPGDEDTDSNFSQEEQEACNEVSCSEGY